MRKIYLGNINKMATVAILMSDKIDSKTNLSYINKDRKKHFIMLKWMIQQ